MNKKIYNKIAEQAKQIHKQLASLSAATKAGGTISMSEISKMQAKWDNVQDVLRKAIPVVLVGVRSDNLLEVIDYYVSYEKLKRDLDSKNKYKQYKKVMALYIAGTIIERLDAHEANSV